MMKINDAAPDEDSVAAGSTAVGTKRRSSAAAVVKSKRTKSDAAGGSTVSEKPTPASASDAKGVEKKRVAAVAAKGIPPDRQSPRSETMERHQPLIPSLTRIISPCPGIGPGLPFCPFFANTTTLSARLPRLGFVDENGAGRIRLQPDLRLGACR